MAPQTEGADIVEVTLAAAFNDRNNMICVPEGLAGALSQSPVAQQFVPSRSAGVAQGSSGGQGIDSTIAADAAVAEEYLLAEIPGLGPQLPLMDAIGRAEGKAPGGYLERAPAAQSTAVWPAWDGAPVNPTALHHTRQPHTLFYRGSDPCSPRIAGQAPEGAMVTVRQMTKGPT